MGKQQPEEFHMKDLFIDVKLEACVNGTTYDYLGKKLFSSSFYRKNIGFGITNIDIEVNTSLQPLVTITFKDLYGNTIFGTQKDNSIDDEQSIDYSTIFNWPPPKFLFSFKGYLGKSVTWILNLKRTSTAFDSSDGSYTLKCEFVPNQWGFFADLPFLFLLAAKRLRKDTIGPKPSAKQLRKVKSVFDLLKIGKQVEVKTKDTTKEFDDLVKQLGSIKSNMARAMVVSNILGDGETIDGVVNNRRVKDFLLMELPTLGGGIIASQKSIDNPEKIEQKLGNPNDLRKLNSYLLLLIKIDGKDGFERYSATNRDNYEKFEQDNKENSRAKNQQLELVKENLGKIDDEIKRLVFDSSESKLEKITIGEIFGQTAKDAAFIIGSIIDAGLDGYRGDESRQKARNGLVKAGVLIGESFPLVLNDKGEEVPATADNLDNYDGAIDGVVTVKRGDNIVAKKGSGSVDVDGYEMDFVKRFINAISEGIARDLISDSDNAGQDDSKLLQRINNMEMTSNNPYKPYYTNIATNILVRGGIVGHMTRSSDPNIPGSYNNIFLDNDGPQNIKDIADRDVTNITDTMLKNISDIDMLRLKRFCKFFTRFYTEDGDNLIKFDKETGEPEDGDKIITPDLSYLYEVSMGGDETLDFFTIWNELKKPSLLEGVDFSEGGRVVYNKVELSSKPNEINSSEVFVEQTKGEQNAQNPLSFVDNNFKARRIVNNGIVYTFMDEFGLTSLGDYWAVLFRGEDNKRAQEANSAPSDTEYKNEDKDATDAGQNEPLGYIPVSSKYKKDNNKLQRVETLEEWRDSISKYMSLVLDYDACKNPTPEFYGAEPAPYQTSANGLSGLRQFTWVSDIAADSFEKQQLEGLNNARQSVDVAGEFGYTVCHHQSNTNISVFEMFGISSESRNQRIFIRRFCDTLLKNLDRIEDEKNKIIGNVLGKAGDSENAIYKQMHVLFHQWQSLSYNDQFDSKGRLCGNVDEHKGANGFNVADILETRYGTRHYNMIGDEVEIIEDEERENNDEPGFYNLQTEKENEFIKDGTFIYDFPLQRINGLEEGEEPIRVRDSIINLDPLYKINGSTTVLNIIQNVCTKNNFLFIPIPGNPDYLSVNKIYSPDPHPANFDLRNFFHVLFTPTPESRTKTRNTDGESISLSENHENYSTDSFVIKYGSPDNQIVKDVQVGTDDNKVTAESIVNLQRLVDNDNQNKKVTTDCSMLPVLAGRSYKATVNMLGNAQVYPMQFFFLKNSPLFGGLYQVMKVNHSITPNDMSTSVEGIRMRFASKYGGISPITLQTFRDLGKLEAPNAIGQGFYKSEKETIKADENIPKGTPASTTASIVEAGDNNPAGNFDNIQIAKTMKRKGYFWDRGKNGAYKLNIVGIRNTTTGSAVTNRFDDLITLTYTNDKGQRKFFSWKATTEPGQKSLNKPRNRPDLKPPQVGTSIMKPGQYKNSHIVRLHAKKYPALGQSGKLTVFRDANKDSNYDKDTNSLMTGYYGVNIHHAGNSSTIVDTWSAGCQVFADIDDWKAFFAIVKKAREVNGNKFNYTLLESKDIPAKSS